MRQAKLRVIAQLVQHERIGFFAKTPVHHQDDDFQIVQRHRVAGCRHGAINDDFTHMGRQHAGRLEKTHKSKALSAQVDLFRDRVDTKTASRLWLDGMSKCRRLIRVLQCLGWKADLGALGCDVQTVKPDKGCLDFLGFKSCRGEFAAESLKFGASVTLPIILVDVHQYFKHVSNITQKAAAVSSACRDKKLLSCQAVVKR